MNTHVYHIHSLGLSTYMLLNLELLKLLEPGASGLQMQVSGGFVDAALVGRAGGGRGELQRAHRLVRLRATSAARVRSDYYQRLHVRATCHYSCGTTVMQLHFKYQMLFSPVNS